MVLAFMIISTLYHKSVCVNDMRCRGQGEYFSVSIPSYSSTICWKHFSLPIDCFGAFVENPDSIRACLLLGTLFYSSDILWLLLPCTIFNSCILYRCPQSCGISLSLLDIMKFVNLLIKTMPLRVLLLLFNLNCFKW